MLQKVTIASLTQPPPASLAYSLTITDPPFGVIAMTDRPFLASITLEWASSRNKPTQVEHWVEVSRFSLVIFSLVLSFVLQQLDSGKGARPVLGEEQVIDIELDRYTELLPRREDVRRLDWNWNSEKRHATMRGAAGDGASGIPDSG